MNSGVASASVGSKARFMAAEEAVKVSHFTVGNRIPGSYGVHPVQLAWCGIPTTPSNFLRRASANRAVVHLNEGLEAGGKAWGSSRQGQ